MIDPDQLNALVIVPTLQHLHPLIPFSDSAVNLLMGTAAQESDCGTYIRQIRGPALGIWQMEPATAFDHHRWLDTQANRALFNKVWMLAAVTPSYPHQLISNLTLACAMARVHYWRAPGAIPSSLEGQAAYWKQWYNTPLGAGTIEQYIANYRRIVK